MTLSRDELFGRVYDKAYLEMQMRTGETDIRKLNGAARNIAQFVVKLVAEDSEAMK